MNDYHLVDYGQGIKIPFYDAITESGIDRAIRFGMEIFPPEEKLIFAPPFVRKDDIVYDVGAYCGTHSILFMLWGAQVYAFEPSPFNYPRCVKNCAPFKQIRVFDAAFHEKEYDVTTQFRDCNNPLPDNNDAVQFIKYKILDKFIADNNLPIPDFIKMDIEGMETIVFKTLHNILSNNKTIVYVERHRKPEMSRDLQHYEHNPNWRFVDEGGYDFNDLRKYPHDIYNFSKKRLFIKMGPDIDLNGLDESLILIPQSKVEMVKDAIRANSL